LSVAFSPDGSQLASGSDDTVCLLDVKSGSVFHTLKEHTSSVWSVEFSPDGNQLVSGSVYDIFIWQQVKGNQRVEPWIQLRFSRLCSLLVQDTILHGAIISKRNTNLLQQRGAQSFIYWVSEKSIQLFAGFFNSQDSLFEGGKQLTRYLNLREKQAMSCMNRSSYAFFKRHFLKHYNLLTPWSY